MELVRQLLPNILKKEIFGLDDVMNISNKVFEYCDERITAWYLALGANENVWNSGFNNLIIC